MPSLCERGFFRRRQGRAPGHARPAVLPNSGPGGIRPLRSIILILRMLLSYMARIHPTAIVDPSAELADDVEIGPYCMIGAKARIGAGSCIMSHAHIRPYSILGQRNQIHMGAIVGHDPQYVDFNPATVSHAILGDDNVIREYVTIHRGIKEGSETRLGNKNYLMAMSHVAHDCRLGDMVILANYVGLAGHVEIGDRAFISGFVGVHQFVRIGKVVIVSGMTRVKRDVPPFMICASASMVFGLNVVGLRRAGVSAQTRTELNRAYKKIFRSGLAIGQAVEAIEEEWKGKEMPPELRHMVDFCAVKSKRGLCSGPRKSIALNTDLDADA